VSDNNNLNKINTDFSAAQRISYMNTGTVGLMPDPVLEKLFGFVRWYNEYGPALPEARERKRNELAEAQNSLAKFLKAEQDEVEFMPDTTSGMNAVISALPLQEDDQVLVTDIEHYAGRVPWAYMADRKGLDVKVLSCIDRGYLTLDDILAAVEDRTRVISISHVSFTTGGRTDLKQLGDYAEEEDIFLLVDGAQSAGALDLDAESMNCDAFAFPGYKWCLGPEGTGGLYINSRVHDYIEPEIIALGGAEEKDLDGNYTLKNGAELFGLSTEGVIDILGLGYSLSYLNELGMDRVQAKIKRLTDSLIDQLVQLPGIKIITPGDFSHRAGLVSFEVDGLDADELKNKVDDMFAEGVHVRTVPRPVAIRASLHIYNDESDIDRFVKLIEKHCL